MKSGFPFQAIVVAAGAWLAPLAEAAPITITNPGFEDPETPANSVIASDEISPILGWSIYGPLESGYRYFGVVNPDDTDLYLDLVPEGSNLGVTFFYSPNLVAGGLEQVLSDTLQLNTTYTLTVDIGNMATDTSLPGYFDFDGFPGYRVELLAGGTVLASDDNTLLPDEGRFLTSIVTFSTGASHANAGSALGIRLINLNGPGIEVNFDDVSLDASTVPEPSTIALALGGALIAALGSRFRKRS